MYYEPYTADAVSDHTAYCHRLFVHAQAHRRLPQPSLQLIRTSCLRRLLRPYGLRLTELTADDTDLVCQLSLRPDESPAAAAGKLKGRLSKALRSTGALAPRAKILARGYLAYTIGDTTATAVSAYLDRQARKHGYAQRAYCPCLVRTFASSGPETAHLRAAHSVTLLRYHLVFGTMYRKGVFSEVEASRVLEVWQALGTGSRYRLLKVSVVPDHMHVAVRLHPAITPLDLAVHLMNTSQEIMFEEFPETMITYGSSRLWENGVYIGSFGDVTSSAVQRRIRAWRHDACIAWDHGARPWPTPC